MQQTIFETDISRGVEVLREQAGERWRVPASLLSFTTEYYTRKAQQIREHLNAGASQFWDISPETENVLLEDYARALFGVFDFAATRDQMEQLRALRSTRPFLIDSYGLYYAVLGGYKDIIRHLDDYDRITAPRDQYRGAADQTDELRAYINGPNYTVEGRAVSYLLRTGQFNAGLFAGVSGPAEVNAFLDRAQLFAAVYDYATYYGICKHCLNAPREVLDQIPAPRDMFGEKTPQQFAEQAAAVVARQLARFNATLADIFDTPTAETIEQAREQVAQAQNDTVRIPDTFAAVLSRNVYGSAQGANPSTENDILPIQLFISDYMDRHSDETGTTTPLIVEKTIEGVNMLQRIANVKPANGLYTFKTNISQFAELCGYTDANEDEKRALFLALRVLDGLYLAVWRPRGLSYVRVLSLREIGATGQVRGDLIIDVTTEAMGGRPQLLGYKDFERMRREAKGYAENHFRYQIVGKGHKKENDLLDEVFGYTNAIKEAKAQIQYERTHKNSAEVIAGIQASIPTMQRNQQKHKPRDRKRLQAMFEREAAAGFLTYRKYTNAKGETVYSWNRTQAATPQEPTQEPDEQEQPK